MWVEKHRDVWRIRDTIGGRKVDLATGYATKTAAKDAMAVMRSEALRGDALVPRGRERTIGQFCEDWWSDVGPTYTRVRSNETLSSRMERYIIRLIGTLTLGEVEESPALVQRWVNDLSAGRTKPKRGAPRKLAPKTVRDAHGLLYQILDVAVRDRLIRANPCASTRLPEHEHEEMWFLTPAEADRLVAATAAHWRPHILFLLATGCRFSELRGLRAKNLDVLERRVRIVKKTIEDRHGQFHDEDPKSKRGRRSLRFPARVAEVLIPLAMVDDDRERRIFLGPRSGMIRNKDFYEKVWNPATVAAGLKGLTPHDLRHTHVAWLIAGGVPMSAISRRLGHKSAAFTDDQYGHLLDEVDERLVASLDDVMSIIEMGGIGGETVAEEDRPEPARTGSTPAQRQPRRRQRSQ